MPSSSQTAAADAAESIDPVPVDRSLAIVASELAGVVDSMLDDAASLDAAAAAIRDGARVFVLGAGRSGLALQMTAMRLMHLGLTVHVVGEVTTPAIGPGDVLLVASGSGTTAGILRAAGVASDSGAGIVCITTAADSPLAGLSTVTIVVPAAQKLDRGGQRSAQYAGGLFEQSVVLIGDAIFHSLWKASGATADELWPRHANIE
ncbi:MAG: 6-phospho-3-hexuloisomerase [Microbacteriaceae bacterium]|nr:6-phospho-3-hexuloisomerase [Microbacteriaceae bacterium]